MKILVTGGAGYIGSHTCVQLLNAGNEIAVVDNLSNSSVESLNRVKVITGKKILFYNADLTDKVEMEKVFAEQKFEAVIHFAGFKAVGESVEKPLMYYENNLIGTFVLLGMMKKYDVKSIVFSSSATVYGNPASVPITEDFPLSATNPYGRTKLMLEEILQDVYVSDKSFNIAILRYFNPVGAHESGNIGEDPNGIPNNLLPYISQVAVGKLKQLSVFGNDYNTPDGTGVRDYIHVVDLADGHLKALEKLQTNPGIVTYNLGTGNGYSVIEMIKTFEEVSGKNVPYQIVGRRPGDIASCYANPEKANNELSWQTKYNLKNMCASAWKWQSQNPGGYK